MLKLPKLAREAEAKKLVSDLLVRYSYRYLLAFGTNLGDLDSNCLAAQEYLEQRGVLFLKSSKKKKSKPLTHDSISAFDQPDYCNFVADVATNYSPNQLYLIIKEIEDKLGHSRTLRWASRHMDIDILFWVSNSSLHFADCIPLYLDMDSSLKIPHYDFFNRLFLLELVVDDLGISLPVLRVFAQKKSDTSQTYI